MVRIPLGGFVVAIAIALTPHVCHACACGCGVFDVQTSSMLPTGKGGTVFLEYDYSNQNKNWSGTSKAPAANNSDKQIRTGFMTAGVQYMFTRKTGVMVEVPYWQRFFKTTDDSGNVVGFNHSALGDIRVKGIYTGFSPDMSTGITYGLKLATGDSTYPNFDRDTEIGTGSTDLLLGAFHSGRIPKRDNYNWFASAEFDQPFKTRGGYRPGNEIDAVAGVYYHHLTVGHAQVIPLVQVIGSSRMADSGAASNAGDSGYQRLFFSPGFEVHLNQIHIDANVAVPVYQKVNGNQLVSSALFKVAVSHDF